MHKEDYEEFKESIAVAEIFVEMKANQTQKEAKQAQKEAKQAQKEASKKNVMAKKIAAKTANKIDCSVKCSTRLFYSTP
jgi:purine-nucleoside phosphorylase